jgi:rod shape-determining protein MreD
VSAALRIALLVFLAALFQAAVFSAIQVLGGTPEVLLVTLISIALLRGSIAGAAAGFAGGLIVDVATLGTLGVTSLLLTVAGFWAGRYGETTGRDRAHAPLLAVVVITLLVGLAAYTLNFLLGEDVSARQALVTTLLPTLGLNLIVGGPIYALCRWVLRPGEPPRASREVEVVV